MLYRETSAKTGRGVTDAFLTLFSEVYSAVSVPCTLKLHLMCTL